MGQSVRKGSSGPGPPAASHPHPATSVMPAGQLAAAAGLGFREAAAETSGDATSMKLAAEKADKADSGSSPCNSGNSDPSGNLPTP